MGRIFDAIGEFLQNDHWPVTLIEDRLIFKPDLTAITASLPVMPRRVRNRSSLFSILSSRLKLPRKIIR